VIDLDKDVTRKNVYDLTTNELITSFIDSKSKDGFTRFNTKNKVSLGIKNGKVIFSTTTKKFPLIRRFKPKKDQNSFNKHIGSFDLETYHNNITNKTEVYAIGFCYGGNNVMIEDPSVNTYYLDKGITSDELVLKCINDMLVTKYNKCIFYTHNLGGYDGIFILKILAEYNQRIGEKYYKMKAILKENRILKLEIKAQRSKAVTNTILLVDSLALLPMSLSYLSREFSTKYQKPNFPYTFVTEKTLYYIGDTPSIEF